MLSKTFRWFIGFYIVLFFAVILPFHHHADLQENHQDCVICAALSQTAIGYTHVGLNFVLIFIAFILSIAEFKPLFFNRSFSPRGPPLF
jgi:hypothetical protein